MNIFTFFCILLEVLFTTILNVALAVKNESKNLFIDFFITYRGDSSFMIYELFSIK